MYTPHICHSLARSGSNEHNKFCECFDIVVADESITPRQLHPLNILEPWRNVCAIDEGELVMFIISCSFFVTPKDSKSPYAFQYRKMKLVL